MLPEIPKPPETTNAPFVVLVETVVLITDTVPDDVSPVNIPSDVTLVCVSVCRVPVMLVATSVFDVICPKTPKPPERTSDPVLVESETDVLTIDTVQEKVGAFITENVDPDKTRLLPAVYVVNKEPLEYIDDP